MKEPKDVFLNIAVTISQDLEGKFMLYSSKSYNAD